MTAPKLTAGQKAAKSVEAVEKRLQKNCFFVCLVIVTFLLYLVLLLLNLLATNPSFSRGAFTYGVSHLSQGFPLQFMPAEWGFYIWNLVHLIQLPWMIYCLGLLTLGSNEDNIHFSPVILSPTFFISFIVSSAFNIGWLFLFDHQLFLASLVFMACTAISSLLANVISTSRLVHLRNVLLDQNRYKELMFLQTVFINCLAALTTWSVFVFLINLGILLFKKHVSDELTSIVCLSIVAFLSVIYIGLDATVLARFTRYCLAPYLVVTWSLAASISNNYNPGEVSTIMAIFNIGAVSLACLIKLGLAFYRSSGFNGQYRLIETSQVDEDSV